MSVYFDNAATNPLDKRVQSAMEPYLKEQFYNASPPYKKSRDVRAAFEMVRNQAASLLGCEDSEIIFTSGGTEADNLAIKGIAWSLARKGRHLITSSIEHHAILDSVKWLVEKQGFSATYLPVDKNCCIDPQDLKKAIRPDTILISTMWVNNEIGTIQPVKELAKIARAHGVLFHSDAVQAASTQEIDVNKMGLDLLTISAHKIYGPKGAGILYCRKGVELTPLIHGGQQENYVRGGTESVANIIGFGKAIEILKGERSDWVKHLCQLKEAFINGVKGIEGIRINGCLEKSVQGIVNIGISGINAESALISLDQEGIQASMGSACTSESIEPSHVMVACKVPEEYINGCLRFSFGKDNSLQEVRRVVSILRDTIKELRNY